MLQLNEDAFTLSNVKVIALLDNLNIYFINNSLRIFIAISCVTKLYKIHGNFKVSLVHGILMV